MLLGLRVAIEVLLPDELDGKWPVGGVCKGMDLGDLVEPPADDEVVMDSLLREWSSSLSPLPLPLLLPLLLPLPLGEAW